MVLPNGEVYTHMPCALRSLVERAVTRNDYFHLPHVADEDPEDPSSSYYYDLRARIDYPGKLQDGIPVITIGSDTLISPIGGVQLGLAYLQHYWDTGDESHLHCAERIARSLVALGDERAGLVWRHRVHKRGCYDWMCAMVQGQAASLLLRVGVLTGDERFMENARAALAPLDRDIEMGGVRTELNGYVWFEEHAIMPPKFTLNGYIVALLGVRDAMILLGDDYYCSLWDQGLRSLKENLTCFDASGWSLYDLSTRNFGSLLLRDFASPFYHRFHIQLLMVIDTLTGESVFTDQRREWMEGLHRGGAFYRGVFGKAVYRMLTPTDYARS